MIKLWSAILFGMLLSTSVIAGEVKTEYITEETCTAIAGCWIDTKTGKCPDCVTVTRKVVTETKIVVESYEIAKAEPKKTKTKKKKTNYRKKTWVGTLFKCNVGCRYAYWDSDGNNYDKNFNRIGG